MGYLVLVRHGESRWNLANKFTGWVDVPLSEKGIKEALQSAKKLKNLNFDVAFTSKLTRAHETLLLILAKQTRTGIFLHESKKRSSWANHPKQFEKNEIPIFSDDALNERFYGALQGKNKEKTRKQFGEKKVHSWRRSWDIRPPKGEALKDTYNRTMPYFKKKILPQVKKGKNVIVSAHGNSLRAIIKHLDNISNDDIPHLELPTGEPQIYKYSKGKLTKQKAHSFTRKVKWK
ncbi:MAG: 2,3-bisphosphoglycerate-dependent phosphoglycerate mutase [Candidatus Woesearchaeota archaeon]|jgi:2,3-bisphosphoglycerate-dependent phosphoglycerate mutase|nr:2,3-bisphosphoglycerate-dependent phosphoglycerate mutase [Candidatus Woesearchaeota archaeon]